jgi:hypothetical protein
MISPCYEGHFPAVVSGLYFAAVNNLAPLAWVAHSTPEGVSVTHGPQVEVRRDRFFEGIWDGPFEDGEFADSLVLAGSGGILRDDGVLFATPTHQCHALWMVRRRNETWLSNSLPLLLHSCGEALSPRYPYHVCDLLEALYVPSRGPLSLPLASGRSVEICLQSNMLIRSGSPVLREKKSVHPRVASFAQYRTFLTETLARLIDNATDLARAQLFRPVLSLSSGYDSTACAVLCRDVGCSEAITFELGRNRNSRDRFPDSGIETGARLGLDVTPYDNSAYLHSKDLPEAECLAGGALNDVIWWSARKQLSGAMLITGLCADWIWSTENSKQPMDGSFAGSGYAEAHLYNSTILLPFPPFPDEIAFSDIHSISVSAEMTPWSVGGWYDRPIPRRIAEEAGIPRGSFATEKKVGSIWQAAFYGSLERLLSPTSLESFRSFEAFAANSGRVRDAWTGLGVLARMKGTSRPREALSAAGRRARRGLRRLGIQTERTRRRRSAKTSLNPNYLHALPTGNRLFLWGVGELVKRNRAAMEENGH